jgi:hypothetical protein
MRGSGTAREARRRPELDLLVGPLEAAGEAVDPELELIRLEDASEQPVWREDG